MCQWAVMADGNVQKRKEKWEVIFFESKGKEDWKEKCIVSFKKEK